MALSSEIGKSPQRLISVIVPIHNMADRLANLFSWLGKADELRFQVILVCDRCTDLTKFQLETFIEDRKLANVAIVESQSPGPGSARNYGMKFIEGKYTLFWDSDDVGNPQETHELLRELRNCDVIVANYSTNKAPIFANEKFISNDHGVNLSEFARNPGLWRCIFLSSSIEGLNFGSSNMGEDQVFLARLLVTNPEIEFHSSNVYKYFSGVPNQLTSIPSNISGLVDSTTAIKDVIQNIPSRYSILVMTIYAKLCFTGIKRGNLGIKRHFFLELFRFLFSKESRIINLSEKIKIIHFLLAGKSNVN